MCCTRLSIGAVILCICVAERAGSEEPVSFELQVQPIMAARGCSTGACHGKQHGQNGFQLSLLGFDPDFDYLAQVMVNRVWADLMGRGLVEPVDDLRATNPPSNGPLLEALAEHFRKQQFDIKELLRTITTSYVYGLSSQPTERNVADTRNYSRHYRQRLRAEVLLDAVAQITGVPDRFAAMPPGSDAKEIWTHRVSSLFLDTFGRPDPNQDPPCERQEDATVTQALHMMNATALHEKVTSDSGRAAKLAASDLSAEAIKVSAKGLPEGLQFDVATSEAKGDSSQSVKLVLKAENGPLSTPCEIVGTAADGTVRTARFPVAGLSAGHSKAWLTVVKKE